MKEFKFKFSKLINVLIYVGIALCAIGLGVNIYLICTKGLNGAADPAYPIIEYTMMFFVTILLAVILISIAISSKYVVSKDYFATQFGIIKSKFLIKDIEKIELNRDKNKLSVYMNSGEYTMIVVNEEWYGDFVESILENNKNIEYSIVSETSNQK